MYMSQISTAINSNIIPFVVDIMPCEITLFKIRYSANCFNQQLYSMSVTVSLPQQRRVEVFLLLNQFNVSVYYSS